MTSSLLTALQGTFHRYPLAQVEPEDALEVQNVLREELETALAAHPAALGTVRLHQRLTQIAGDYVPDSSVNGDSAALVDHQMEALTQMTEALKDTLAVAPIWAGEEVAADRQATLGQREPSVARRPRRRS